MFSSLYSMLPSAQRYLQQGGLEPKAAAWATIGSFLGGVLGIQVFSRLLHHYIPSHVVDCDNPHNEGHAHGHSHGHSHQPMQESSHHDHHPRESIDESTPLIAQPGLKLGNGQVASFEGNGKFEAPYTSAPSSRRPTLHSRLTTQMSTLVAGTKTSCEEGGPCYGYTDPGGRQCYRTMSRSSTTSFRGRTLESHPRVADEEAPPHTPSTNNHSPTQDLRSVAIPEGEDEHSPSRKSNGKLPRQDSARTETSSLSVEEEPHHHHVPENAFLSIGLQTSIAIALHKLPEGFITYATNHANPQLGFSVFMALFIHNISEGFAMALPLYLAINSRAKAMFWSSLLGGASQPLGAGIAALWFHLASGGAMAPGDRVYGCMFSITAGIMASVALQLFSESLSLTHNRNICALFAFLGMGVLGASRALTAQ